MSDFVAGFATVTLKDGAVVRTADGRVVGKILSVRVEGDGISVRLQIHDKETFDSVLREFDYE